MYEKAVSFARGLILMILNEKTINPKFRKRIFMKMESENTLGPAGPPLQMPASKLSISSRVRELRAAQSSSPALDPSPRAV